MTDPTPERGLRVGARVAVAVAVVAALVLGGAIAVAGSALVGVVGAGLLAVGAKTLASETNRDRARGSVALVAGSVALCVAVVLATQGTATDTLLVAVSALGVTAVALDALVEDPAEASAVVGRVTSRSGVVIGIGLLLSLLVYTRVLLETASLAVQSGIWLLTYSDFVSLFTLQVLAVGALVLVRVSLPVLEEWTPDGEQDALDPLRAAGIHPLEIPWQLIVLLAAQALVAAVDPRAEWFAAVLDSVAQLGEAIHLLLYYGVLHAPLLLVWLLASVVLVGRALQRAFVWWAGRNPPETVAYATGGVVAAVLGVVVSAVGPISWYLGDATGLPSVSRFGAGAMALGAVLVALLVFRTAVFGLPLLSAAKFLPSPPGYAAGAILLFLAAVGAGATGATPLAVFVGVAAAVLVWDLGRNATILRKQLGRNVETRATERTHATASVLVGVGTVGLATVATYVVGPGAFAPADPNRAMVALVLSVIAVVSFVVLIER